MINSGGEYLPAPTLNSEKRYAGRKTRRRGPRFGKDGKKRNGVATPLLRWKLDEKGKGVKGDESLATESSRRSGGWTEREDRDEEMEVSVSARKLAAGLWRLQSPKVVVNAGRERRDVTKGEDRLGFQPSVNHVGSPLVHRHKSRRSEFESAEIFDSSSSVSAPNNGSRSKLDPSCKISNSVMEGATKWDPICPNTTNNARRFDSYSKPHEHQVSAVSLVSALEADLEQARARIQVLETDRKLSKRKIEHFLKKLSEERSEWRRREHDKVRVLIDDMKSDLDREKRVRLRLEIVNSKLLKELDKTKLSSKQLKQEYEKERKDRELIEEVCEELAKEIGEDKTEAEDLKRESMNLLEEVEQERKMLQMTEVWREERVQMKLIDAKIALEEKYSEMNKLVAELQTFLRSKCATPDLAGMREAEKLHRAASSVNIEEITKFSYEPADPNDIFSVFENCNINELSEREIGPYKDHVERGSNKDGDIEYQDPSCNYSPKIQQHMSGSGSDWEEITSVQESPKSQISEVCIVKSKQVRKVPSISRLWKSRPINGEKYKVISIERINRQLSNGSIDYLDCGSGKSSGPSPTSLVDPHITRGKKSRIELPHVAQKNSLKGRALEAKMQGQKVQLRQVLDQNM